MKKIFILGLFLIMLTGCGSNKEVLTTCTLSQKQLNYELKATYNIYSKNKVVNKAVTIEEVTSTDDSILSYFENYLNKTYKSANDSYGGYTYSVKRDGNKIVSNTTIDYTQMNLDLYVKDNSAIKSYVNKNNKLTVEAMKKIYEQLGAECK